MRLVKQTKTPPQSSDNLSNSFFEDKLSLRHSTPAAPLKLLNDNSRMKGRSSNNSFEKRPHPRPQQKELSLSDFIVESSKGGGKKKGKKGKRRTSLDTSANSEASTTDTSMNSSINDMSFNTTATPPGGLQLMESVKEEEVVAMTPEKKAQFANAQVIRDTL